MRRVSQDLALVVVGAVALGTVISGAHHSFVKPSLAIPIVIASALILVLGAIDLTVLARRTILDANEEWRIQQLAKRRRIGYARHRNDRTPPSRRAQVSSNRTGRDTAHSPADLHRHQPSRVMWLAAVPFVALALATPPPLGAYSARTDSGLVTLNGGPQPLPALPDMSPLDLTLRDFAVYATYDTEQALAGKQVRLTGFALGDPGGPGWVLARMQIACCAADASAVKIEVHNGREFADGTWVEVIGTWLPDPDPSTAMERLPILTADSVRRIDAPTQPYE